MFRLKETDKADYKKVVDNNDQEICIRAKNVELMSEIFELKGKKYVRIKIEHGLKLYLENLNQFCILNNYDTFILNNDTIILKVPFRYNKLDCIIRSTVTQGLRKDVDFVVCGISNMKTFKTCTFKLKEIR